MTTPSTFIWSSSEESTSQILRDRELNDRTTVNATNVALSALPAATFELQASTHESPTVNAFAAAEPIIRSIPPLSSLTLGTLDVPQTVFDFNTYAPAMVLTPDRVSGEWRLGMRGSYDLNYIFSPENEDLGSQQDTTLGYGYTAGITLGYKKGRWAFETGGVYVHKSYPPNFLNQFNPNGNKNLVESEYFQDIQLDLLQIPFTLQYFAVNRSKWRMYTTTGVSLNMLMTPVYKISEETAVLAPVPPSGPSGSGPDGSLKNKTEFPVGILQGGSYRENSYWTANLGLGFERTLGERWTFFAEPNYQHFISQRGLKPFKDKFYTLSLSIGTRVSLR